jgi:CelD/BcsL family acetyltransferase involved in cellulose biosynthesis
LVECLRETDSLLPVSVYLADKEMCVATGIFLVANRELCLWGWAHRHEYGSYCPVELLTWTAIEKAMGLGCRSFDLFGGGKAKEKYGGARDYGIVRWMHSSLPGLIAGREAAKRIYRRRQKLKGGLLRTSTAARTP